MVTVEQSYEAHTKSIDADGKYTAVEIPYIVTGVQDEDEALRTVLGHVAHVCQGLELDSIEIDARENATTYRVNAIYRTESESSDDSSQESATISFDCGGGTKHMTHSLSQKKAYGSRDAGGAIGWNGKTGSEMEITGVDIPTAQLRETYTKIMRLSKITTSFKKKVAELVGKVNSGSFHGWSAGEVMFLGMSYSSPNKKNAKVPVSFNFAIQPNESSKVGSHKVSKKGFEYVWALSKTTADSGVPKAEIEAIFVDTVCETASFSSLGV